MFHQSTAWPLHMPTRKAGIFGQVASPWSMAPTGRFGMPQVLYWAALAGAWGGALVAPLNGRRLPYLLLGFAFGALAPLIIRLLFVAGSRGTAAFNGENGAVLWRAPLHGGAWDRGTALLRRPLRTFDRTGPRRRFGVPRRSEHG